VIDFRYHLVSIVAVFLALAIGIVLGSTELQGNTIDGLRSLSNSLKNELNAANAQRDGYQQQASAGQQFLQSAESKLLDGALAGDRVVIVTEPGAPRSVTSGIKQAAGIAGATVTGVVALSPKFNDLSGATQSSLYQLNSMLASADRTVLAAPADQQTAYQQQAAQLIATAILAKTAAGTAAGTVGAGGLSAPDAQTLLATYAQAGYLTVSDATVPATLAVIVIPQTTSADGRSDPANQVLLAVAQQFAAASDATIVVGSATGSSPSGSAISVLRSSSVSSQVSSVDNADSTLGQISSIWALQNLKAGEKANSYGLSGGASAVSPVPLPEPSATATTSPTPRPTAKGKDPKSVKKK
jgi:hypothetical protein